MILFSKIRWKNLLSTGNQFTEVDLLNSGNTLVVGTNGAGKCLRKSTKVDISFKNEETRKKYEEFMKNR